MKLTLKQQRFADEYIICANATQAAIKAGYSKKTAGVIGDENLKKPYIRAYIDGKLAQLASEKIADQTEVLQYLTSVMRGESTAEIVVVEGEGEGYSSARHINKAPDERERLRAAELLGKRHGLFTEKVNLDAPIPVIITGSDELED